MFFRQKTRGGCIKYSVFSSKLCHFFFSPAETIEEIILTEAGKLRKDQSDEEWLWLNGSACGCDKN